MARLKDDVVMVVGSMARENVAVGRVDDARPVAPLAGVDAVTVGGVGGGGAVGMTSMAITSGSSTLP